MTIKNQDFVLIDFVARIKETNKIFDLTDEEIAKKENLFHKDIKYSPVLVIIGENTSLRGLEKSLIGKEVNQEYTIEISPEEGFGKKDPKLIRIIPSRIFKEKNINPFPGLQVNIDNIIGTIRSVSGGRIIIDFNHPLAGKNLIYQIKIVKKLETDQEKTNALLEPYLKDYEIELNDTELTIKIKNNLQKEIAILLEEKIKKYTKVKNINIQQKTTVGK